MPRDEDEEAIIDVLNDEYARDILVRVSEEPLSADELVEATDASGPTVYRRLNRLESLELVEARTRPDPDGHHYKLYAANVDEVRITVDDGDYAVEVERRVTDAVDRFTELIGELS